MSTFVRPPKVVTRRLGHRVWAGIGSIVVAAALAGCGGGGESGDGTPTGGHGGSGGASAGAAGTNGNTGGGAGTTAPGGTTGAAGNGGARTTGGGNGGVAGSTGTTGSAGATGAAGTLGSAGVTGGAGRGDTTGTGGTGGAGSGGAIGGGGAAGSQAGASGTGGGAGGGASTGWVTVHNDFFWYDVDGNPINVRSGTLRKFGDLYYWYGAAANFRDQTCYTSPDLVHWTYKGIALHVTPETNRMDVLYNASTKTYVMFLKYDGNGAQLGIATSSTPEGPYTLKSQSLVDGAKMGDFSVYQDDDGKAYLAYVSWKISTNGSHGIFQMSDDHLTTDNLIFLWKMGAREAPHIFKRNGIYYYGTSGTAWLDPTPTQYYTASALAGPWTAPVTMPTPGSNTTYESQCDFVYPFKGTQGTVYMFDGDRWLPKEGWQGGYVWLPLSFDAKGMPSMTYYQDWDLNPALGTWRQFDAARDLARGKTATASSETGANVAANVTKTTTYQNYTATHWDSTASDPQWIMVDLGAPTEINRAILKWGNNYAKAFNIEVSTDGSTWMPVYGTTKGARYSVTDVTFGKTQARYVRMNGTQRGTQNGYSLFSFMVLHDP